MTDLLITTFTIVNTLVNTINIIYLIHHSRKIAFIDDKVYALRLSRGIIEVSYMFLNYHIFVIGMELRYMHKYKRNSTPKASKFNLLLDYLGERHFNSYKKTLTLKWIQSCEASGMQLR